MTLVRHGKCVAWWLVHYAQHVAMPIRRICCGEWTPHSPHGGHRRQIHNCPM